MSLRADFPELGAMKLPFYWIDAFADRAFAGNPAGVVVLDAWLDDALMQQIAFEHGLAETAFVVRAGPARYQLRWFTPAVEVDLCGHATLATAHALFHERGEPGDRVTFDSRSGPLTVARRPDGKLELDFPATPVAVEADANVAKAVAAALGAPPAWLGRSRFDRFAVLASADAVRHVQPDLAQVAAAGGRGLIVTAPGNPSASFMAGGPCDFVSRWFGPQSGITEDPATGSAHCALAPYWATRLGKTSLHARQLSARGAELWCEVAGDRIRIAGHTTLYLRGEITPGTGPEG